LLATIVAEHELVEIRLELIFANAVMGSDQPLLKVADSSDWLTPTLGTQRGIDAQRQNGENRVSSS
jgi:hypothetical protein